MSWKDKLENNRFAIETGDGKVFFPLWKGANKVKEFNTTAFNFIDVDGTYVDRRKPKSAKYDIVIYFQGDDCWSQADDFETAANDPRYWIINHPIYGNIKGQPISISRNDSTINVVEFQIDFWESIISQYLERNSTIKDEIETKKEELAVDCANEFQLKATLTPASQNKIRLFIQSVDAEYKKFLDDSNYNEYQRTLSQTRDSIDGAVVESRTMILDVIRTVDSIKNLANVNVFQKVAALSNLFNLVISEFSFKGITDFNRYYVEVAGSSILSTMALVGLNPGKNDYISRNDVLRLSTQLDSLYTIYAGKLDLFESGKNNKNNNFNSSFKIQSKLNFIVKKTLYDLFSISFKFKQERVVELFHDSNLILLTHKYLGLDEKDENLDLFREINGIKNEKLFTVKKGSKIIYLI